MLTFLVSCANNKRAERPPTQGLGRESAVRLARAGARVVLTTRSEAKGVQAVEQVTLDAPSGPGVSRKNS